jgi:DNA-binding NtrC family response regulator
MRVLVLEAYQPMADLIKESIERNGHEVETVDTASQALSRLQVWTAHVLVSRVLTPGMDPEVFFKSIGTLAPEMKYIVIGTRRGEKLPISLKDVSPTVLPVPLRIRDLESAVQSLTAENETKAR